MHIPELIAFLDKWQTLMGSFLGGIFALSVAFIVGHAVRRREEISSAMVLIGDLANLRVSFEVLTELAEKKQISNEDYPYWLAEKLTQSFPQISKLFESSIARMLPVDKYLAAHLTIFYKIYKEAELTANRIKNDIKVLHKEGKPERPNNYLKADARIVTKNFTFAVQHANCAEQLLTTLVLSNTPTFNRLKQFLCPGSNKKECIKLLTKGSS